MWKEQWQMKRMVMNSRNLEKTYGNHGKPSTNHTQNN